MKYNSLPLESVSHDAGPGDGLRREAQRLHLAARAARSPSVRAATEPLSKTRLALVSRTTCFHLRRLSVLQAPRALPPALPLRPPWEEEEGASAATLALLCPPRTLPPVQLMENSWCWEGLARPGEAAGYASRAESTVPCQPLLLVEATLPSAWLWHPSPLGLQAFPKRTARGSTASRCKDWGRQLMGIKGKARRQKGR